MDDENIINISCFVSVLLSSVTFLYCLYTLYKVKGSFLWIKNRSDFLWLIVFTGIFSILNIGFVLYIGINGHDEIILLVTLILLTGAIFIFLVCRILTGIAAVFARNQQLEEEGISDEAMGIYHREYFVLRIKEEFTMAKRHNFEFSILLIAVDYFEKINTSYGQEYTSRFIKSFGEFVKNSVRETDIIARFDREEIIILLQNTGIDGARIAAQKLQNAIENKTFYINTENELNELMIACTVSVGVSTYSPSMKNSDQMIEQADVALFKARDRGRNQVAIYGE